jgi:hypothetical protein
MTLFCPSVTIGLLKLKPNLKNTTISLETVTAKYDKFDYNFTIPIIDVLQKNVYYGSFTCNWDKKIIIFKVRF